ncbi:hypothetical protein PSPHG_CDS_0049 [Pseudomonas phage Psxphi15]
MKPDLALPSPVGLFHIWGLTKGESGVEWRSYQQEDV